MEQGGDLHGVGDKGGQWLVGMGGPDKRRCGKGLGFEIGPPSLAEKDGTIKISNEAQL